MRRTPVSALFASTLTLLFPLLGWAAANPTTAPSVSSNSQFNSLKRFDFSTTKQLQELPAFGDDPSSIKQGKLIASFAAGDRTGLSKKFYFENDANYTNEAEVTFDITLDSEFHRDTQTSGIGKFAVLEGIESKGVVEGGNGVIAPDNWAVRIGHWKQNANGKIPLGLTITRPNQSGQKDTSVNVQYALKPLKTYRLKLYVKLNDVGINNGVVKLSANGKQVYGNAKWKLRLRKDSHVSSVWLRNEISGKSPAPVDTSATMDNLRIRWNQCTKAGCPGAEPSLSPLPPNTVKATVQ